VRLHETSRQDEMVLRPETRYWDVLGRDRDEIRDAQVRDWDVGHFGRDETETRRYVSRPREMSRPRPHPCNTTKQTCAGRSGLYAPQTEKPSNEN